MSLATPRSTRRDFLTTAGSAAIAASAGKTPTISYRLGRKLVFNPDTETVKGDAEANQMLTRRYRAPYVLPDKV